MLLDRNIKLLPYADSWFKKYLGPKKSGITAVGETLVLDFEAIRAFHSTAACPRGRAFVMNLLKDWRQSMRMKLVSSDEPDAKIVFRLPQGAIMAYLRLPQAETSNSKTKSATSKLNKRSANDTDYHDYWESGESKRRQVEEEEDQIEQFVEVFVILEDDSNDNSGDNGI